MDVVGLVVEDHHAAAVGDPLEQRVGGRRVQVAVDARAEHRLDGVRRGLVLAARRRRLVEALDVGEVQDSARGDRRRVVLQQHGEIEVVRPLGRDERVAAERRGVAEVALQPLEHDEVRSDDQKRRRHRRVFLVQRVEVGPDDAQAHRHRLAGARRHLDRQPLALRFAGLDRHAVLGELEEILEPADGLDLGEVDDGLDGFALAEVEAERAPIVEAVLVGEPEAEQPARGRRRALVALRAPRVDARPHAVDGVGALAGLASLRDAVRVAGRTGRRLGGSLDPDLGELRRVVAEDVDDLHDDRVACPVRGTRASRSA